MTNAPAPQPPTGPTTPPPAVVPPGMVCAQCGYELGQHPVRGHQPPICSECGRPVSPKDIENHARLAQAASSATQTLRRHYRAAIVLSLAFAAALFVLSRSWHGLVAGILLCVLMFGLAEAAAWAQGWCLQPEPRRVFRAQWLRETLVLQGLWVLGLPAGVALSISERRTGQDSHAVPLLLLGSSSIALICAIFAANRLRVRLEVAGISRSARRYSGGVVIVHTIIAWLLGLLVAAYSAAWLQMW